MEPRIQYAQTSDGVSIAYWTLGEGIPFIFMPPIPFSHIQLEWQIDSSRRFYEQVAEKRMLVRYDGRGTGLSDRDVADFSLDALLLDLIAVVDDLGLDRFALFGPVGSGTVSIAYAARNPDRVSHLLLWNTWDSGRPVAPQLAGIGRLMDRNWELYTETVAHSLIGWSEGEQARRFAAMIRECVTPEVTEAINSAPREVAELLPAVRVPTLVLHRQEAPLPDLSVARRLAARIPNARLALLGGTSVALWMGDRDAVHAAIDDFLGDVQGSKAVAALPAKEDVHTILFTDIEASTALTQRLGDAKAQEMLRTHNSIVRGALNAHGGSEIKHTGDGIMASFSAASRALECAITIQRAFAEHSDSNPDAAIRVRIGLNAGEPVAEDEDLFGTAVQLAARICAQAEPGQILAPVVVRELAAGKRFLFADRGETALRGFEDPIRLYEVSWRK